MENILINFTADPSGLQPGIDGLEQMNVVDKELADQVKKTGQAIDDRNKKIKDSTKQSGSELEKLVGYFKNLDKSIVGGAFTKTLKDLDKAVTGVSDHYKALSTAIDIAKKKQADFKPNSPEWKELYQQIQNATEILSQFQQEQDKTTQKTTTLKTQLRALKEEIATRLGNGESLADVQDLIDKAGELDDRIKDVNTAVSNIGSDTRNIEGLIEIAGAGVGAFSAMQGSLQLMGAEEESTQKAMQKLFAVMAILQGVQQVQNALQKESAATLLIENAQRRIAAFNTQLQTYAESENVIVKYASIAASRVLNAVMAASPAGILVVAIGALAAVMLALTSNTNAAAKAQADLNQALNSASEGLDAELAGIDRANKKIVSEMKNRGASDQQLTNQEISNTNIRIQARQRELESIDKQLSDENNLQHATAEDLNKLRDKRLQIELSIRDDQASIFVQQQEQEHKNYELSLKSAQAFADQRVLIARKESRDQLNAQIEAIRQSTRNQTDRRLNPNITSGEIAQIYAEANQKIADLNRQFRVTQLEATKSFISAQVLMQKEGSKEELSAKLAQLEIERQIQEASLQGTVNDYKRRAEIEADYYKKRNDLIKAYNRKVAEDTINTQITETTARISQLQLQSDAATNAQLLANKKELIDQQAALEVVGVQYSILNEEEKRRRIKAIYDKSLADKIELEKQKKAAEIQNGQTLTDAIYDRQIAKAQLVLDNERSTYKERRKAATDYFNFVDGKIAAEQLANQQSFDNGLITYEQYLAKKFQLDTEYDQNNLRREQQNNALRDKLREEALKVAQELSDAVFQIGEQKRQAELDAALNKLDKLKDAELSNKSLTEDQKDQINKKYAEKERILKRKAFEDEKKAKIAQAIMNGALAITNILATRPKFDLGIGDAIMIAAAAASTAIQVATIENTPIPQFYKGTKNAPKGFKWVGERGPELIYDQGGYPIIPHQKSMQLAASGFADASILKSYNIPPIYQNLSMPNMSAETQKMIEEHYYNTHIDYEKLTDMLAEKINHMGKEVSGAIEKIPQPGLSVDERGFTAYLKEQNSTTEYLNKKINL